MSLEKGEADATTSRSEFELNECLTRGGRRKSTGPPRPRRWRGEKVPTVARGISSMRKSHPMGRCRSTRCLSLSLTLTLTLSLSHSLTLSLSLSPCLIFIFSFISPSIFISRSFHSHSHPSLSLYLSLHHFHFN